MTCGAAIDCAWGCPGCVLRDRLAKDAKVSAARPAHAKRYMPAIAQAIAEAQLDPMGSE